MCAPSTFDPPLWDSRAEIASHSLSQEPCTRILDPLPCPEGSHHSSSLLRFIKSADEHNGMPSNVLFGRGFGEYIVTLVKLRKGCLRQACSTPDTTFVSLPTGGRNLQPTYSVDNAFEGTRQHQQAMEAAMLQAGAAAGAEA